MTPSQLRLARSLLDMTQSNLATAADVSRATVHRYESGLPVGAGQKKLLELAIQAAGAVIIPDGALVDGMPVYGGVGLRSPMDPVTYGPGGEATKD